MEFAAALGVFVYAGAIQGSGWNRSRLAQIVCELAAERGVTLPTGGAWEAVGA
jgi:hypothetical protein